MGSVQSDMTCPYCEYAFATIDSYYKTGEEYFFCGRCGSTRHDIITNHDERTGDPDDAWTPKWEDNEKINVCCIRWGGFTEDNKISGVNSVVGCNKEEAKTFKEDVLKDKEMFGTATITFKNDEGVWVVEDVLSGKITPMLSDPYGGNEPC